MTMTRRQLMKSAAAGVVGVGFGCVGTLFVRENDIMRVLIMLKNDKMCCLKD